MIQKRNIILERSVKIFDWRANLTFSSDVDQDT